MNPSSKEQLPINRQLIVLAKNARHFCFVVGLVFVFSQLALGNEVKDETVANNDVKEQWDALKTTKGKIEVAGNQIIYDGVINEVNNKQLFDTFKAEKVKPKVLVMTSIQAMLDDSLALAEWMLKEQIQLHIPEVCAGFCANYVVAAASSVTLNETAVVAWPGNSPIQHDLISDTINELKYWHHVIQALVDSGSHASDDEARDYWNGLRKRHREFYKKTPVDPLITVAQFVSKQTAQQALQQQGPRGPFAYTLSLDSMRLFGRNEINVIDNKAYRPQDNEKYGRDLLTLALVDDAQSRIKIIGDALNRKISLIQSGKDVHANGQIIHYEGSLTESRNNRLFALYEKLDKKPTILSITSAGGLVTVGLDLGNWIFENNLEVRVPTMCGSSCANYVLTAAKAVKLGESAIIFWHGSPVVDDLITDVSEREKRRQGVRESLKETGYTGNDPDGHWESVRLRNREFFKRVGVNPLVTDLARFADAPSAKILDQFTSYTQYGVYVALEELPRFDLHNVTVEKGKAWRPQENPLYNAGYVEINLAEDMDEKLKEYGERLAKIK